jgi:4-hydroxybenzoate polyprenyltransferase
MLSLTNNLALLVALPGVFPLHALYVDSSFASSCGAKLTRADRYPLMKRWTNWPQLWLGFAMNWGVIPGWVSVTGDFDRALLAPLIVSFAA